MFMAFLSLLIFVFVIWESVAKHEHGFSCLECMLLVRLCFVISMLPIFQICIAFDVNREEETNGATHSKGRFGA
jgi:hypothetical protein